jgi:isopentenyl diphosphate isomerase/L-lactate dehydrogenase-like FMN-dependent dehydrogenase
VGVGEQRAALRIGTVEDARRLARRRVPRIVFDYIDGAAGAEATMQANRDSWESVQFRPQMGVTVGSPGPDLTTEVLGSKVSMPVLLAPVGFTRVMDPMGDVAGAQAARDAGTLFVLSTMSGHTIEEVAAAAQGSAWFQLYGLGGRSGAEQLVDRAQRAGFGALVVTLDTPIPGNRERDVRHGVTIPLRLNRSNAIRFAPQVVGRPRWLTDVARDRFSLEVVNATGLGPPGQPMSVDEALMNWVLSPIGWADFDWLRQVWRGPIVAKGIITGDDARRAADCGVAAVVVSNHGGRQLDGVPAAAPALVEVLRAVGDSMEIYVDGGIRRGSDVVRAMALGARAVLVGRPWAFGLAAAGEAGVRRVLSILRGDTDRTLRLLGCPRVTDLHPGYVRTPPEW